MFAHLNFDSFPDIVGMLKSVALSKNGQTSSDCTEYVFLWKQTNHLMRIQYEVFRCMEARLTFISPPEAASLSSSTCIDGFAKSAVPARHELYRR